MDVVDRIIEQALYEDIFTGDITIAALLPEPTEVCGSIIAKEEMVVAGMDVAVRVFHQLDPSIRIESHCSDGQRIPVGHQMAGIAGDARMLLKGERVALNFLQRLSGIATLTARYVEAVAGTTTRIVDTRKTTPGLRILEKFAVRVGGGHNHRFGLYDGVLIKENHIAAAGGIAEAITRARHYIPHTLKIEIEVESLDQLQQALTAGADIIMLDNMTLEQMRQAVVMADHRAILEASGGMTLERVRQVAEAGVDIISVGALTHSARAMDISLLLEGA
ncbi:MAG TPA: carboxylating nicotinate-nucleotide diphosphorylase [Geobacterales bacterium]|nr:carboxylating nicotinate-nucleotide diphosphorylase [Geobacterales bacterium]